MQKLIVGRFFSLIGLGIVIFILLSSISAGAKIEFVGMLVVIVAVGAMGKLFDKAIDRLLAWFKARKD